MEAEAEAAEAAGKKINNLKNSAYIKLGLGGYMSLKEEFKLFIKSHPELIKYVRNGEMTWQKFYETYSIYGKDEDVWNKYFNNEKDNISEKNNVSISDIMEMVKKVDLSSVQKNITNISKGLSLIESLITKNDTSTESYTPRPLYKKFED